MKHCIRRNSKVIKFILTLVVIGLILGIVLYFNLSKETKDIISNSLINLNDNIKETKQNNIIFHLFIIFIFIMSSLTILLYPLTFFYLLYEVISYGFILAYYISNFKLGGLVYSIIYFILNKALFMLVLIYLSLISFNICKKIINSIRNKDNISVKELYQNYFLKIIVCVAFILIIDILVYFFGNKILNWFQFLI